MDPRLSLIVLRCTNIETTRGFYEACGFTFTREQHGTGPLHYSLTLGDTVLELYPASETDIVDRSTRLGFIVPDAKTTTANLKQAGCEIRKDARVTSRGCEALLRDPDGRTVELVTPHAP